jgi:thiol-disulfide isomerase/thioredoxin
MALESAVEVAALEKRVEYLLASGEAYASAGLSLTEDEKAALRRCAEAIPEDAEWGPGLEANPRERGPAPIRLVYFDRPGCAKCDEVKEQFDRLGEMYPNLEIATYNVATSESAALLNVSICRALDIPAEQQMVAPSMFSLRGGLVGDELTLTSMAELAEGAKGMASPARVYAPRDVSDARSEIEGRYRNLGLLVVISAGLLDGINPCAFSVIIFFLSYLAYLGKDRREIASVGGGRRRLVRHRHPHHLRGDRRPGIRRGGAELSGRAAMPPG